MNPIRTVLIEAVLALVVVLVPTVLLGARGATAVHRSKVTARVTVLGPVDSATYTIGDTVTLTWKPVRGAAFYDLQINRRARPAVGHLQFVRAADFHVPSGHQLTYDLKRVHAFGYYYWRVRAWLANWTPYTARRFTVSKPRVGTPSRLSPRSGTAVIASRETLCWQSVPGAVRYEIWVGSTKHVVTSSCLTASVRVGSYKWSVRAVQPGLGGKLYFGPWSSAQFTIQAPPTPPPPPTPAPLPTPVPPASSSPPANQAPVYVPPAPPPLAQPVSPPASSAPPSTPSAPQAPSCTQNC